MRLHCGWFLLLVLFSAAKISAQQGVLYRVNPNAYYYFLTPTGFSPPPGRPIYQNALVGICQYQKTNERGTTKGIGLIPSLLLGADYMPVWVFAHRRFPIGGDARHPATILNIGGWFLNLPKSEDAARGTDFSMLYANSTFGTAHKNIAIGVAVVPSGLKNTFIPRAHALTLHGMVRLHKRSCLLTENYIIRSRNVWMPCLMGGWRGWKKRTSFDIAILLLGLPPEAGTSNQRQWVPIPWLAVHQVAW